MKNIFCSKCGGVTPGLDESEFDIFDTEYMKCVESVKAYRRQNNVSLEETPLDVLYEPAISKFKEITGFEGNDAFHLRGKHRASEFRFFCESCELFFRAPTTQKCPQCGVKADA